MRTILCVEDCVIGFSVDHCRVLTMSCRISSVQVTCRYTYFTYNTYTYISLATAGDTKNELNRTVSAHYLLTLFLNNYNRLETLKLKILFINSSIRPDSARLNT